MQKERFSIETQLRVTGAAYINWTYSTKHGVGLADKLAVNLVARYLVARYEDAISVSTEKTSACFRLISQPSLRECLDSLGVGRQWQDSPDELERLPHRGHQFVAGGVSNDVAAGRERKVIGLDQ